MVLQGDSLMANKIVKYTLNSDGTIPTEIADGGYYPKNNSNASPQDYTLIGAISEGSSFVGEGELDSKTAVKNYLDSYSPFYKLDENNPSETIEESTTDIATTIWNKKT